MSRMQMQLPTRRLPAAAAVLALAGAVVVVVGFQETMRRTELVGLRVQSPLLLYDVDPRTSGSTYYAEIAGQSQGELSGALEAAKQAAKAARDAQIAQAAAKQAAGDARMRASCEKNPSLPGCPYSPPLSFETSAVDPDTAGPLYYAMISEKTNKDLDAMDAAQTKRWKDNLYAADVVRYQKEVAAAERMVASCDKNPSLPGCPFTPNIKPPVYPDKDMTQHGPLIYNTEGAMGNQRMEEDYLANKAVMDRIHAAERAAMQASIEKGIARMEVSCQMNPSLPGCPY